MINKQGKVLVIEDDPTICELITLYTKKNGYITNVVNNGMKGLALFYEDPPDLVNDLLDLARIEAGQLAMRPVSFNLSELVRQVVARLEPEWVKNQTTMELIAEEALDIYVIADPDRIEQVLVNLLQNAIQFSAPARIVEVMLQQADQAVISIHDHGPGIKPEEMSAIWERFYKADRARTIKAGTGLGLSIVKHILDLHQSPIHVQSEVGKGTIFTFTLPLAPSPSKKA